MPRFRRAAAATVQTPSGPRGFIAGISLYISSRASKLKLKLIDIDKYSYSLNKRASVRMHLTNTSTVLKSVARATAIASNLLVVR